MSQGDIVQRISNDNSLVDSSRIQALNTLELFKENPLKVSPLKDTQNLTLNLESCFSEEDSSDSEEANIEEQVRNSLAKTALHHVEKPLAE